MSVSTFAALAIANKTCQKSACNLSINLHKFLTRREHVQMLSLLILMGGGEGKTEKGLAAPKLIWFSAVISCF